MHTHHPVHAIFLPLVLLLLIDCAPFFAGKPKQTFSFEDLKDKSFLLCASDSVELKACKSAFILTYYSNAQYMHDILETLSVDLQKNVYTQIIENDTHNLAGFLDSAKTDSSSIGQIRDFLKKFTADYILHIRRITISENSSVQNAAQTSVVTDRPNIMVMQEFEDVPISVSNCKVSMQIALWDIKNAAKVDEFTGSYQKSITAFGAGVALESATANAISQIVYHLFPADQY
jgi:hypothetical protein